MRKTLMLALAALLAGCSTPAPKAEYTLTYASPYPPTHPFSKADIAWMAQVEKDSGGRIAFKPYWSGALISSDMSELCAMSDRCLVLSNGKITGEFVGEDITQENVMRAAIAS